MVDNNSDVRTELLDSKGHILLGTTEIATQQIQHDNELDKCMENENHEESRAMEGLDTGWAWVVLIASFWTFFMVGGTMYANGIMHVALMERYNESVSLTSWAGALHTGMFSLSSPVASLMIDNLSCRTTVVLSGVCFVVGYMATAFAPNIYIAILTCGFVAGLGGGLGYTAAMVVVTFNFKTRRNFALGLSNAGVGAGLFALAPLMQLARSFYGNTGFFIILAAMTANIITLGMVCFPSNLEKYAKYKRESQIIQGTGTHKFTDTLKMYYNSILTKGIIMLSVSLMLYSVGTYSIYFLLPSFTPFIGFTPIQASFFLAMSGIAGIPGRTLTGVISNIRQVGVLIPYVSSMAVIAVATFIYPFVASHYPGQVIYVTIFGMLVGSCYVVTGPLSEKFVPIQFVSSAIGLQFMAGGVGAVLGPVFSGLLLDNHGSFTQAFLAAGAFVLAASIFGAFSKIFERRNLSEEYVIEIELKEKI